MRESTPIFNAVYCAIAACAYILLELKYSQAVLMQLYVWAFNDRYTGNT